ncbi:uncharacterized protein LOC117921479 [Vitis riparia]|uniref:uncharacterized protein LOC117921479 n=1 Tax=Vitis riparia TaxID=96939 RepID=UPI00155AED71|nr:uncharacterized protein LOC117921479 [Vitis riparia]
MLKSVDPNNQAFEWKKQMFIVLELLPWKLSVEEATLLIGQKRNASIVLIGHSLKGKGNLMGLVNPRLGLDFNKERDHGDDQHSSPVHKRLSSSQASYAISCEHA